MPLKPASAPLEGVETDVFATLHDMSNDPERLQFACREDEQFARGLGVARRLAAFVSSLPG